MSTDLSRQRPVLDALCITALRRELETRILGGSIQRVEVRANEMTLVVYAHRERRRLFCHVGDDAARVHLTNQKSELPTIQESPMLLQLRKRVRGGRIVKISQPRLERLLELEITTKNEEKLLTCGLIIETMGRRSNAILVDSDRVILDALRRTPPSRSPQRPVLPRLPYETPAPQDRIDPGETDLTERLETAASTSKVTSLADFLGRVIAGFSPGAAREAAFRATSSDQTSLTNVQRSDWSKIAESVCELVKEVESDECQPHVAFYEDVPISVTPYRPTSLEENDGVRLERYDSMSAAVESAFAQVRTVSKARVTRSAAEVARSIRAAIEIEQRRSGALAREIPQNDEVERLRSYGEAIFANLANIPRGAQTLEFNGLTVPLDPLRSPVEVANEYFSDYAKRRDAAAHVPGFQEASAHRLEYLESLLAMAEASDVQSVHRQIARELEAFQGSGAQERPRKKGRMASEPQPRRFVSTDGFTILVGTNGAMNDRVTFKVAAADDVWLHARGEPGAHVILRSGSREPSRAALQMAANLAARYSRARASGTVAVDHTLVKNVRKIRGAPPGLVRYVNEQMIQGHPDEVDA